MVDRESRFPSENRQTYIQRSGRPARSVRRPRRIFPVFLILAVAAGWYIFEMPGRPWQPFLQQIKGLLSERDQDHVPVPDTVPQLKPRRQSESKPARPKSATPKVIPKARTREQAKGLADAVRMDLPIGMGFRPVGFRIWAVSKTITLTDKPGKRIRHLPGFSAERQKYGVIKLGPGREFSFAIDLSASGYGMYLDRNRNGNLRDDGPALVNRGKGLFATRLKLPLNRVSGVRGLKGDYLLWIFTNPGSWKQGQMHYYAMTQLMGELMVNGKRYKVFLADNGPLDGDYRNDGINIDLNQDGKITRSSEHFPSGKPVMINGESYNFRITR